MKRNCFLLAMAFSALTLPVLAADKNTEDTTTTTTTTTSSATWTGTFGKVSEGAICLRLDQIVSVSIHNYMMNGTVPITELTIDTTGNNSVRIYSFMMPDEFKSDVQKMIGELKKEAEQAGSIPQVAKQYPETTHVHSIEYAVTDATQLQGIYNSIIKAMAKGKSTSYSISK